MIRAGLAQMDISWEDFESNRGKVKSFFREAREKEVDILVFPEMTMTGFSMNVEKITRNWQAQRELFADLSAEYGIASVCGYPVRKEEAGEVFYENHLEIFDETGSVLDYAKIHPFSYGEEARYYRGGKQIRTACWRGMILGAFVCYDLRFPEVFQISSAESQLIFVIASWPAERTGHWDVLLQARAIENQAYIVGVNRTGTGGGLCYRGHSAVYGPEGERLTELTEEETLLTAEIDSDKVESIRRSFPVKQDRKADLYYSHLF